MRAVVIDALSGRQVPAGPEEVDATQPLIYYLTQRLGWNPRQMMARPQWRVPKSPSGSRTAGYPCDIAIFDSPEHVGDPRHVRVLCECKAPNIDEGIDQLKTYLSLEPEARLGIWFNGQRHTLVFKLADRFVVSEYSPIPRPTDPLTPAEANPPRTYDDLLPPPNMGEIFWRLRDRIAAQDTKVNRDEYILNDLANLLVCKIADEQLGESEPERHLAFQSAGGPELTAQALRHFFQDVKQRLPSVFTDESDRIHIDDASLFAVVKGLEHYRLLGYDRHAVGTAFQILRGRALQGEEGAYFTPPPVVDCVVRIVDPDHKSRLIDTACGTGGFLAAALDHVFEAVDQRPGLSAEVKLRTKRDWAHNQLNAADKDFVSTKLCKAYLTLLGDGRAHVYRANMIDRREWSSRTDDLARFVAPNSFDIVMTNPPFGKDLVVSPEVGQQEELKTCQQWKFDGVQWEPSGRYIEQQIGIAFFERNINLLKEGGRLAIVLPETFLFSKSFRWFVDWISQSYTITHVVDVPMVAFEEFCRAKTCILFVTKSAPAPGHQVLMSFPKSIGQDKKGNALYRLDEHGSRNGDLDNEMAEAVEIIVGREYRGTQRQLQKRSNSRLCFYVKQTDARSRGIMVPRFWWRDDTRARLSNWQKGSKSYELVSLGELADEGAVSTFEGHGSPPGNARATGEIPYVKVTDLKNWRINENPTNFVHHKVADKLKGKGVVPMYGDLITPARASSNIGQFCMVLPWQTNILLTKEVLILRCNPTDTAMNGFLLLAMLSLKDVQEQYKTLVLMQTNREHLGDHWREVILPIPILKEDREHIAKSVRAYFEGIIKAKQSLSELDSLIDPTLFGSRP